jgi:ABC-type sugar transport system ATPase subunit
MESGKILDSAITASSVYDHSLLPGNGRLNVHRGRCAWAPMKNGRNTAWFQVDLGDIVSVTGVATQGRCEYLQWVTSYTVSYSNDGQIWEFFKESGNAKVGFPSQT